MPWLTFGAPGSMTSLHHAQTNVGRTRADFIAFFMIAMLDERKARPFKETDR